MRAQELVPLGLRQAIVAAADVAALTGAEGLFAQNPEKAKPLVLKATHLETFIANRGVKTYTNQGIVGLGEGSAPSKEATAIGFALPPDRPLRFPGGIADR